LLCHIFSYDFLKMRNLTKIFLRSFENVAPGLNSSFDFAEYLKKWISVNMLQIAIFFVVK